MLHYKTCFYSRLDLEDLTWYDDKQVIHNTRSDCIAEYDQDNGYVWARSPTSHEDCHSLILKEINDLAKFFSSLKDKIRNSF